MIIMKGSVVRFNQIDRSSSFHCSILHGAFACALFPRATGPQRLRNAGLFLVAKDRKRVLRFVIQSVIFSVM